MERRRRHRLGIERAVKIGDFLSELAHGLAGVNLFASDPGAPKKLVAAAARLDALSGHQEGARQPGAALSQEGAQPGAARAPRRAPGGRGLRRGFLS